MTRILLAVGMLLLTACRYYRFEKRAEQLPPPPVKVDVLIVPGYALSAEGKASHILWNRVLMAKVLIDRGYATRIIVSGGLPKRGVTEAAKMAEIAVELGLSGSAIHQEPRATSSVANGQLSAELMAARGWKSAIVVTDPRHLSYAIPVFRDAFLKHGLDLFWTPVDYELLRTHELARHGD